VTWASEWESWGVGRGKEHADWNDRRGICGGSNESGWWANGDGEVRGVVEISRARREKRSPCVLVRLRIRVIAAHAGAEEVHRLRSYAARGKHGAGARSLPGMRWRRVRLDLRPGSSASKGLYASVFAPPGEAGGGGERSGMGHTAFYTVLMEGEPINRIVVDAVAVVGDGPKQTHGFVGRWPAGVGGLRTVNVCGFFESRLMPAVTMQETPESRPDGAESLMAAAHYALGGTCRIGAYKAGTDEALDRAIRAMLCCARFLNKRRTRRDEAVEVARLNAMEL